MDNILYHASMTEQILIENGLSEKEAKVYLSVLAGGELTFSHIALKTHIKRTTIYHIVDMMKTKGLLSLIKRGGVQYVSALSPRILIERFKDASLHAEHMLPDLLDLAYASPLKPRLQFFEGMSGIKEILSKFAHSKHPSMGFTNYEKMPKELFQYIRQKIIPLRKKNRHHARLIAPNTDFNRSIQKQDSRSMTEHRMAPFTTSNNRIELLLFGESNIAFLSFAKDEMFGVIVDSKAIYSMLENIFLLVWSSSRSSSPS